MARALGMYAERVEHAEDLPDAMDRALANRPALLDVLVTTDAVSADAKSGLAWVPDFQPLATWEDAERKWRQGASKMS
jgi:acetolactate synthase-1/2/3 large subunit